MALIQHPHLSSLGHKNETGLESLSDGSNMRNPLHTQIYIYIYIERERERERERETGTSIAKSRINRPMQKEQEIRNAASG